MRVPGTIGLCPNPSHMGEFYMPDPTPGDICPYDCPCELLIYRLEPGQTITQTITHGTPGALPVARRPG